MVYLSKGEMETLRSAFNAQLASVMESLLAAAVCEIAKIFESSLCEHQAELLQKTNEISILRSELEKVERSAESVLKAEESGPKVKQEPDPVNISDDVEKGQNTAVIKEEGKFLDEALESQHQNDSQSNLELATIHASEMQLSPNQQKPLAQAKDEAPHYDQSNLSASQPHEEHTASPSLSVSPKVCCNTSQMEGWLPALNSTRESTIENLQLKKTAWSDALNRRTDFGFDENLSEENNGAFVNQGSESPTTSNDIQSTGRREGGPKSHLRQVSTFRSKERPQSHSHTFALRNMDCLGLGHHPAGSGLTGRPYTCPYCAKCFAYPSHQRRHLLRHTGVRLHSCQFCDKRFLTPSELTVHTRTHTGERPFSCGQCGKRFARSGNLRAHQRDVHLGKRPFACTDCGKRFAHKGNLRVHHHRVHQGQRYYLQQQQQSPMESNGL